METEQKWTEEWAETPVVDGNGRIFVGAGEQGKSFLALEYATFLANGEDDRGE